MGESETSINSWRIGTIPFILTTEQVSFFHRLGPQLLSFYRALNRLYLESVRGLQPAWIAEYLDQGKPEALVAYSRMKRFRDHLPAVIRPDVIPTSDGMVITELDSVPGGIGLTACLSRLYADQTDSSAGLVGGRDGMVQGFAAMLIHQRTSHPGCMAIVVSEEAKDYWPEMTWMAARLSALGIEAYCVGPRQVKFTEDGLRLVTADRDVPIGLIYRFYELFDLLNIPKSELVQYAIKKDWVAVTPPYKPALEEKLAVCPTAPSGATPSWSRNWTGMSSST